MHSERRLVSRRGLSALLTWGAISYAAVPNIATARAETIEERLIRLIMDELGVESNMVTPEANFVDDLGADSLDLVVLMMQVERQFKIKIPPNVARSLSTVREITDYIEFGRLPTKLLCK